MIAIDPGQSGGIAVLLPGQSATAFAMPATDGELLQKLKIAQETDATTAYLEEAVLFTGRPRPESRAVKYGISWGNIHGMLFALGFRIIRPRPQQWQSALSLGTHGTLTHSQWKNKLKQRAEELFPGISVTLKTADALLILEAARRGSLG